jgi:addiction module HigA family antidote
MNMHNPAHACQLITEWLDGLKHDGQSISVTQLAQHIQITRHKLSRIIHGNTSLSADVALRLEAALGISSDLLMHVQVKHDLWVAVEYKRAE